jgi:hypothetical protein
LRYLAVGDSPFNEDAAKSILQLVRGLQTVYNIKLENQFVKYNCTEQVKLHAKSNYYDRLMDGLSDDIPISLWSNIFVRIQQGTKMIKKSNNNSSSNDERSTSHIYRLLQTGTGLYGHQLSLRIALAQNFQ